METLGSRILRLRKGKKLTQANIAKASGVSPASVTQWEQDANHPRGENLIALAKALDCDANWLLNGQETFTPKEKESNVEPVHHKLHGAYPLISWVQAGGWNEIYLTESDEMEYYPCPINCSESTFLLRVRGKSMESVFTEGELIFVDPEAEAWSGRYVIARLDDDNQATFKQLTINSGEAPAMRLF